MALIRPGGHGPMFESEDKNVIRVAEEAYESSILAAVCHGPGALVNVKSKGKSIFEGANVTGFSDAEEEQVGLTKEVPFLLETRINELGGKFYKNEKAWGPMVQVRCSRRRAADLLDRQQWPLLDRREPRVGDAPGRGAGQGAQGLIGPVHPESASDRTA